MKEDIRRVFQALACDTRINILELLSQRTLCVKALAYQLGLTEGAISQHLRVLKDAGLVAGERRGFHVHYSLQKEGLDKCRGFLEKFTDSSKKDLLFKEGVKPCAKKKQNAKKRKT